MTGNTHRFVLKRQPTTLRLRLQDLEPQRYRLTVGELVVEGAGSRIDERIPPDASSAQLEIWLGDEEEPTFVWHLALGQVDPHTEISGVRARLDNLGYRTTDLEDAVSTFQEDHGLPMTGEVDVSLMDALRAEHDLEG
jgi:hypothetical protein